MNEPNPKAKKAKKTPKWRASLSERPPFIAQLYYFETKNSRYWFKDPFGLEWKDLGVKDFERHLHNYHGLAKVAPATGVESQVARAIYLVQQNWVSVTSDLAGYHGPQVLSHNGLKILIKNSPNLIEPYEGDYATLLEYFDGLVRGEQGEHLNCWCADVVRHVYHRQLGTFIVPILCGPAGCGKSLFQHILSQACGGRFSRPYSAMTGATPFNEHLFSAEHWMIEDEYSSGDGKARAQLGTALKNFVANDQVLNHGKYRTAFVMPRLLQFLTVSLNDELENIAQLPRKHPSLDGKLSLYDCQLSAMPMPTRTPEEKAIFWAQLMKELPAWVYDLIHKTSMPAKWQSGRFMVPWRAEKVSRALDELEPYMILRDLIHILLWRNPIGDVEGAVLTICPQGSSYLGTPTQIASDLRHQSSPVKTLADDLLRFPSECGRLLTRLCHEFPKEFVSKRRADARFYLINPPEVLSSEMTADEEP